MALLGLLSSTAESLIADVHDGDSARVTVASATAAAEGAPAPAEEAPRPARHTPDSPHTCHCVHMHVITLPAAGTVADAPPAATPPIARIERALASVAPEPHFRPPVA